MKINKNVIYVIFFQLGTFGHILTFIDKKKETGLCYDFESPKAINLNIEINKLFKCTKYGSLNTEKDI